MTSKLQLSHVKVLQHNNVNISKITKNNVYEVVKNLVGTKNQELSANYKTSILNTIKREKLLQGDSDFANVKPKNLKLQRVRNKQKFSASLVTNLITVANYVYNFNPATTISLTRSLIDCMISILLITSTNIKTSQLKYLLQTQLKQLYELSPSVELSNKDVIFKYVDFFVPAFHQIMRLIEIRNRLYEREINNKTNNPNLVVLVKPDALNKQFKILYITVTLAEPPDHLGLDKYAIIQPRSLLFANIKLPEPENISEELEEILDDAFNDFN